MKTLPTARVFRAQRLILIGQNSYFFSLRFQFYDADLNTWNNPMFLTIGLFRYIKIQLEREVYCEDKEKGKWMICKYFSHSFQRVSIVFVVTASLSS